MLKIDERHLPELQDIADAISDVFPDGAEFHLGSPVNFFVVWPIPDQPEELTQWSRSVSIYFSDTFLDAFRNSGQEQRTPHVEKLRQLIARAMVGFDDGRGMRRGAAKTALVLDLTHDLTI
ncbi:hypothetical protein LGN20_07225 [Burkholderia cepacia]|uniref:hypothetical protein n=1 Tax=Burkholderia cepacia TaxID=292 RepID=UPI001CF5BA81|nr:hypothetical protein [Burkholderia cepacia]MCA8213693.1 hypothetical protein [Burkholderia cepacia]